MTDTLKCRYCQGETRQEPAQPPHHAKLICVECGRFQKWLSKPENALPLESEWEFGAVLHQGYSAIAVFKGGKLIGGGAAPVREGQTLEDLKIAALAIAGENAGKLIETQHGKRTAYAMVGAAKKRALEGAK